jgi:hypothetical protein
MRLGMLLGITAVLLGTAVPASSATSPKSPTSANRVTFGVEPASANGPDGRPQFSFSVTPGAVLFDHVAVVNYSTVTLSLQLYSTDAIETLSGGYGLLPAGAKPTGAGSWISIPLSSATVSVPPESAKGPGVVVVPIAVHVPIKASPGDHSGGVVASLRTVGRNTSGQNVVLLQRVGTRVLVQVAGVLTAGLTLKDLHAVYQGTLYPVATGLVRVGYVVRNTGNVNLALNQDVDVAGLIWSARAHPGRVPLLLPGASLRVTSVVHDVWPQVLVHDTVTAHPIVLDSVNGVPTVVTATASAWTWAIPWTLLVIVILIVLEILLFRRLRRRRRLASLPGQTTGNPKVKVHS